MSKERLEYLIGEVEAERISYEESCELQDLVEYIYPGEVQLLYWEDETSGVPRTQTQNERTE